MKKKSKQKNLLNALFLVALLALTVWAVFKDQDFGVILHTLTGIAPIFLITGFLLVIVYVCSESVIIKYLLENGQIKTTLARAKEVAPLAEKMITLSELHASYTRSK